VKRARSKAALAAPKAVVVAAPAKSVRAARKPSTKPQRAESGAGRESAEGVVLGAGIAGLASAVELARHAVDVVVLEARKRIGGRIWTSHETQSPLPVEIGAEFVHGDAPALARFASEHGVALFDVAPSHWRRAHGVLARDPGYQKMLDGSLDRAGKVARGGRDRSFADALREAKVGEPARSHALAYVEGFNAADAQRISAQSLAGQDLGQDRVRRVLAGYDAIVDRLAQELPSGAVRLETVAREVRWRAARADVVCGLPAAPSTLRARRVIVAVPLSTWNVRDGEPGALSFDPPLPAKERAAAKIATGNVIKLTMQFRSAFWQDSRAVRVRKRDDSTRLGFLHAIDAELPTWWTPYPVQANVLVGWAGGPKADELAASSESELTERALVSLARALGVATEFVRSQFKTLWWHDWRRDPFARGAYTYPLVGGAHAANALAAPVDGTLFFAGEATCEPPDNGTAHGAFDSGQRAAKEVLASMRRAK
jgi:monoamine oxidase